jgi:subtilisin
LKKTVSLILLVVFALLSALAVLPVYGGNDGNGNNSGNGNGADKVPVIIGFAGQPGPAEEALVRRHGGSVTHTFHLVPAIAASLPGNAIEGLSKNPKITSIDPDGEVHILDGELDNTWGVQRTGAGEVHDAGNRGAGVNVVIIDTGFDPTHPDLPSNAAEKYFGGYDYVNDDDNPADDHGHGTHVGGTVVAKDDGYGVVGMAPPRSTCTRSRCSAPPAAAPGAASSPPFSGPWTITWTWPT